MEVKKLSRLHLPPGPIMYKSFTMRPVTLRKSWEHITCMLPVLAVHVKYPNITQDLGGQLLIGYVYPNPFDNFRFCFAERLYRGYVNGCELALFAASVNSTLNELDTVNPSDEELYGRFTYPIHNELIGNWLYPNLFGECAEIEPLDEVSLGIVQKFILTVRYVWHAGNSVMLERVESGGTVHFNNARDILKKHELRLLNIVDVPMHQLYMPEYYDGGE